MALLAVALATGVGWFVLGHERPLDVVMVYLLAVVIVAMRSGRAASLVCTALSVAAFDFFFTRPYFSFNVEDTRYLLTFVIMLFVALVISDLTERIRRHAAEAEEREERTAKLYGMSRDLSVAASREEIVRAARRQLADVFGSEVRIFLPGAGGAIAPVYEGDGARVEEEDAAAAASAFARGEPAGKGTAVSPGSAFRFTPLRGAAGPVGVIAMRATPGALASRAPGELLDTFASQIALAIARAQLAEEAQRTQLEVDNERLRNALLSSVSHDFRTPLAVVKGAATALLESEHELPPVRRREYLETISEEASRLNGLVGNLLDMTSLQAGALRVRKEWHSLEEVTGVALNRLDDRLGGRAIDVTIPPEMALVPLDATLVEQVLINLVENALKYTPAGTPIAIRARETEEGVEVEVSDSGPGVPRGEEERIFEKFHRASAAGIGMGLGLTICRGIVTAHEGKIWCENRAEGGASFRFTLPKDPAQAPMVPLPELPADS